MGNANSGNVRERHKSGDSLPPSSPCGVGMTPRDSGAFSFEKRPSVGSSASPLQFKPHPLAAKTTSAPPRSEDYPESGRPRAVTVSEGTKFGGGGDHRESNAPKILPTVFKWDGGGKSAYICGTFSDWKTIPMVKSNFTAKDGEDFVAIVDLPEGEHQYKFLVDEEWKHNPSEPTVTTEDGNINNIITVRKTDFEVFDALAMDQCNSKSSKATQLISGSPPGSEWGQDVPTYKPWEKTTGPPILPPHLLQVILNKDTPLSCEPTLLPEPNHVMLNHLYALSIKDGVMVLSATHRYRKKYVTTLLYKPI